MIKLAFSTNAFKRYSLEDSVREIAKIGYDGVEILCDIPHAYPPTFGDDKVQSLKKTLASCGTRSRSNTRNGNNNSSSSSGGSGGSSGSLQISNLNAFTLFAIGDTYHPSWIDDTRRDMRIKHTVESIRLAKKIKAKHLSTEPGGPITSTTSNQFYDVSDLEKIFIDGVTSVAKIAEEEDVKVLIEPEPGLLIENSMQFKNFMSKINNPEYVKLNFDIGHFYCVNEDPAKLVHELSDYIEHFHLADISETRIHNHLIPGKGSINFRSVFDAMDDIGYRGFVTVELYPYQENPIEAAKEAYSYLCSIL
jgi:sugar phosphate isomerase/epimerase